MLSSSQSGLQVSNSHLFLLLFTFFERNSLALALSLCPATFSPSVSPLGARDLSLHAQLDLHVTLFDLVLLKGSVTSFSSTFPVSLSVEDFFVSLETI